MKKTAVPKIETDRVAALDGLRGCAIIAVMFYHFCHVSYVSSSMVDYIFYNVALTGWIGVDLFFVISGFLITRILLNTRSSKTYFRNFYARRVLRIFPLYYGYLIALALAFAVAAQFAVAASLPDDFAGKVTGGFEGQFWFWTYLSNFAIFVRGSAISPATGHLWSLAIEEQFYLAWPLIVYFVPRGPLIKLTVGLIVLALAVRSALTLAGYNGTAVFVFTLSRIDALAWGSLVAMLVDLVPPMRLLKWAKSVFWTAVPVAIFTLAWFGPRPDASTLMFSAGLSIFPIAFAAILAITVLDGTSAISRNLDRPVLKFFGKYSYGLYVVHIVIRASVLTVFPAPILLWGSQLPWQFAFMAVAGGLSVAVALLSWHLYERQFLKLKRYFPYSGGAPGGHVDLAAVALPARSGLSMAKSPLPADSESS